MQFLGLTLKLRFRRIRDPRQLLRLQTRIFWLTVVVALIFLIGSIVCFRLHDQYGGAMTEIFAVSYALMALIGGLRVVIIDRRVKRAALLEARWAAKR